MTDDKHRCSRGKKDEAIDQTHACLACVKYVCFIAIGVFGTNILRNARSLCTPGSSWHKLVSVLYYILTIKFVENFKFFKNSEPELEKEETK